jgi:hypothetical protein
MNLSSIIKKASKNLFGQERMIWNLAELSIDILVRYRFDSCIGMHQEILIRTITLRGAAINAANSVRDTNFLQAQSVTTY